MMSVETRGSSLNSRIPLSGPFAALLKAALIFSCVAFFLRVHTKSVKDPSDVGTLSAMPSRRSLR